MDRDAIAREGRRAEAMEALAFEREREAALQGQVAAIVLEEEGPRVDSEAFAQMSEADVAVVRAALGRMDADGDGADAEDDPFSDPDGYVTFEDDPAEETDELGRLQAELTACRGRQRALERYLAALEPPAEAPDAA